MTNERTSIAGAGKIKGGVYRESMSATSKHRLTLYRSDHNTLDGSLGS